MSGGQIFWTGEDLADADALMQRITHVAVMSGEREVGRRRVAVQWERTAAGWEAWSNDVMAFDVPGDTIVTGLGFYDAPTGGQLHGFTPVLPESFGGEGRYIVTQVNVRRPRD